MTRRRLDCNACALRDRRNRQIGGAKLHERAQRATKRPFTKHATGSFSNSRGPSAKVFTTSGVMARPIGAPPRPSAPRHDEGIFNERPLIGCAFAAREIPFHHHDVVPTAAPPPKLHHRNADALDASLDSVDAILDAILDTGLDAIDAILATDARSGDAGGSQRKSSGLRRERSLAKSSAARKFSAARARRPFARALASAAWPFAAWAAPALAIASRRSSASRASAAESRSP